MLARPFLCELCVVVAAVLDVLRRELEQAREIEKAYTKLKTTQSQLIQAEKMASLVILPVVLTRKKVRGFYGMYNQETWTVCHRFL